MRKGLLSLLCSVLFAAAAYGQTTTTIGSGTNVVNTGATLTIPSGFWVVDGTYTDTTSPGTVNIDAGVDVSGTGTIKTYNLSFINGGTSNLNSQVSVYNTATLNAATTLNAGAGNLWLRTDIAPHYTTANLVVQGILTGTVNGLVAYATATSGCGVSYSPTLSTNISGSVVQYQWESSPNNTVWTPVSGATNATYVPTVTALVYYRVNVTTTNSSFNNNSASVQLNAPSAAPVISGVLNLSTVITTSLSATPSGGTWISVSTGVATIGSTTGLVTGVTAGTSVISYTSPGGCVATTTVSVLSPQNGLDFDGSNDYVSLPSGLTSTYSNFTFEAWVYPTSNANWQRVMDFGNNTNVYMFLTTSWDGFGTPRFAITTSSVGGEQLLTAPSTLPLNTWVHMAVTINGSTNTGTLYINGVAVATNTSMTLNPAALGTMANNWLGRSQYPDPYLDGVEDEVRIWNVVRTQSQIQADMNCDVPQNANLKAYYRLNQGTAAGTNAGLTCAIDYSGNANTGTLTNFTLSGSNSNWVAGAIGTCNSVTPIAPGAFSGNAPVCVGQNITLSNANTGGVWSSAGGTGSVTVNSTSGLVTGVTSGTVTVNYTLNCSSSSVVVTVNPQPTITTVTPLLGYPASSVTIVGTDFDGVTTNNIVYFGATRATVVSATTTSLNVTVPTGATFFPVSVIPTTCGMIAYSQKQYLPTFNNAGNVAGTVNFDTRFNYAANTQAYDVATGDIDGDGKADLVVANYGANNVSVYRNTSTSGSLGAGSFAGKVDFAVNSNPADIALADIDRDGKLDVVVPNNGSGNFSVLRNTATSGVINSGSFAAKVDITAASSPAMVSVADIDGDGKLDVAVTNSVSNSITLHRNTSTSGSISFASSVSVTGVTNPVGIVLTDIDGDGKPDMVSDNYVGNTVAVFRNTATVGVINSGSFGAAVTFATGASPWGLREGDVDGDGKTDIVVSNNTGNSISVFRNTATSGSITSGSFATKVDFTTGSAPFHIDMGDLDGDGKVDIAVSSLSSNNLTVFRNTSTSGTISLATKVDFPAGAGTQIHGIAVGDLDGDGLADVANTNFGTASIGVFRNNPLQPITGTATVCTGSTTALSDATAGGTWSSSNPAVGSISSSGVVTGITGGTITITYAGTAASGPALGNYATYAVTVNQSPTAITGSLLVNVTQTTTLNSTPSGGTWSSTNTAVGTVNSTSGVVTGITAGTTTISYTMPSGCYATAVVTVNNFNNGLAFDGSDDVATITSRPSLGLSGGSMTIEFWAKPTLVDGNWHWVVSKDNTNSNVDYLVGINNSNNWRFIMRNLAVDVTGSSTPVAGTWYHVAAVYDGSTASLYVNGVLDGTAASAGSGVTNTYNVLIGARNWGGPIQHFAGTIDEVRIWNVARTPAQITANMNCDVAQNANLVAYYRFDQGTASGSNTGLTCAYDYSGFSNSATLTNFALSGSTSNYVIGHVPGCNSITLPSPGAFSGNAPVCVNSTITLSNANPNGVWTSLATGTATVGSLTGVVTGVTSGTVTVNYTLNCVTSSVVVTVNPTPSLVPTNSSPICAGNNFSLSAGLTGSGVLCNMVPENTALVLTAPPGKVFVSVDFASYGTPTGACGTFATSGCHATTSQAVAEAYFLGNNSVSLPATNAVFGDPCSGTVKWLAIQATYADAPTTFSWSGPSSFSSTLASPTITSAATTASGVYSVTASYPTGCSVTATTTATVNPLPAAITGNTTLSTAITTTLADASSGGAWTSGATGVATVNSTSGVVSGVTVGTAPITYTLPAGCQAFTTVNVLTPAVGLNFDGTNDYIDIGSSVLPSGSSYTKEAWIYANTGTGNIVTSVGSIFYLSGNHLRSDQGSIAMDPAIFPLGQWVHVAVTYDASTSTMTLYKNGLSVASAGSAFAYVASTTDIGDYPSPHGFYFNGTIDEVRIWNVARSQSQIQADMNCDVPQNANLRAYYRFNEGTASGTNTGIVNAYDYSGNYFCGSLNNFAKTGSTSNYVTGAVGTCNAITITTPAAITGNAPVCVGSTLALANANAGGVWTSSSTATATVNSTSGLVTGVAGGTATITYTLNCGIATTVVTVNPLPTITGNTTLSTAITTLLSATPSGGMWVSVSTGVATVNSTSGLVTGVSVGTSVISYTTPAGCVSTTTVTVLTPTAGLNLDGSNDVVNTGVNIEELAFADFTLEAWIKTTATGQGIVSCANSNTSWEPGEKVFYVDVLGRPAFVGWGNNFIFGSTLVNDGNWHHVAVSWDYTGGSSGIGKMYVDGNDVSTGVSYAANWGNTGTFWLGRANYAEALNNFAGTMDEVRIWNVARTQSQIQTNMNCDVPQNANLKAYYRFNEGTPSGTNTSWVNAVDYSGNGICGAFNNFNLTGATSNYVTGSVGNCNAITITMPAAITGNAPVCVGSTLALANANAGGVWTSSSPATATVNSTSGLVTGVAGGTATITYTLNCAIATTVVTVNARPVVTFTMQPGATACAATDAVYATQSGMSNYVWAYSGTAGTDYNVISGGTVTSNTVTVQYFTPGPHTVSVNYTDANGCTAASATSSTPTTIQLAPTITSVTPLVGFPASSVTIVGTNFNTTTTNNIVYFGATRAAVTSATGTSLSVTVPTGATFQYVSVENTGCSLTGYAPRPFLQNYNNSAFIANTVNFDPKVDIGIGGNTGEATLGDVDGDGKSDIIVSNVSASTLLIYRNISTPGSLTAGSFAAPFSVSTINSVYGISFGDVNGDGKQDIVVGQFGSAVSVYPNTSTSGSISLGTRVDITAGTDPLSVRIADIDKDGKADLVVGNYNGNSISLLRNTSAGGSISFAPKVDFATGTRPYGLSVGDIDGDGKPDIGVSNNGASFISLFRNTATPGTISSGSLAARVDFASLTGPEPMRFVDIDGDSKLDVAIGYNTGVNTVSVYRNTATSGSITSGSFAARSDFSLASTAWYTLAAGDLDGDGKPDLATQAYFTNSVAVLRNTASVGSISFAQPVYFSCGNNPLSVAIGDLDGDNIADIVTSNYVGSSISILRNDPLQPITGTPTSVCAGGTTFTTTTYADATPNGTWTSSNSSIATVGSATGLITGVTAGVATITYAGTANSGPALGNYTVRNVTVNPTPVPTFIVSPAASLCVGNTATYTTQNSQYSYVWSVPGTLGVDYSVVSGSIASTSSSVTIKWLTPGVKTVTVNYANVYGCINGTPASNTTTVNPNPTVITGVASICVGQTTTLSSTPSGGTWTSSNTSVATINPSSGFVNGLSAGTAIMTYTLSTGCYAARAVIVNPLPTISPTNTSPACVGGLVNLAAGTSTVGATTYAWSGPSGFSSTLANPGISGITLGGAGTYTLTAIVTATGCTSTSTTTITVNPVPTTAPTNTSPVCIGGTVNFNAVASAVGTITYSWSGPSGFTSASPTPSRSSVTTAHAGSYVITVTTPGSGCIASATTIVTVNAIPAAAPTNSSPVCAGTLVTLSANPVAGTGVTGYSWSGPAGFSSTLANPTLTPTVSGTYSLTVTSGSGSGCTSTTIYTTAVTINPMPAAITVAGSGTMTFNYTGSMQNFTVPAGVTSITINASGASGGGPSSGKGAIIQGNVSVVPGQILKVLVGQQGQTGFGFGSPARWGGGGGSFITTSSNSPLIIAGGGGGQGVFASIGQDGQTGTNGGTLGFMGELGGTGGNGGNVGGNGSGGGCGDPGNGGGGLLTNGGGAGGGNSFISGGASIDATGCSGSITSMGLGGFGGGGAGGNGGGGGGGYSGGAGGTNSGPYPGGGGGGSYYVGATGVIASAGNTGNGQVTISYSLPAVAICVGNTTTLTTTPAGGTWTSSTPSMATVGASTGVVTGISAGTPTITYTLPAGCYVTTVVTVNPLPASITGIASMCVGASTALSNTSTGGSWSSSNTSIATVGTTGIVTGVAAGNADITYTLPTGCFSVRNVTVNGIPTPISGTLSACVGSTTSLSSTPSGGVWTSSNSAIASVGSTTGVVSGVAAGYATVTYTTGAGCYVTAPVTINPNPAAITGTLAVCAGSTTNLSSATTGGAWSSSSPSVASVGASTGVVTGNIPGTAVITYQLSTGCSTSVTVTVNTMPTTIAPVAAICVGGTTTLSSTPGGGTWSSSSTALATITSGGLVTGMSAGIPVMTYAIGSCYVTRAVTVNPNPAAITGIMVMCMGSSSSLSSATTGGTWSSSAPGIASVSSTGLVTGLSNGTSNITYTLGTGCYTTATVTINTTPSPITGTMVYCAGNTGTLTATPAGGTWTSSNTAMATVSSSGVINAISAGTPTITYGFGTGCMRTATITVNPNPAAITGTATVCVGGTTTLSSTTAGGVWTSGTLSVATIGSSTGIVSGAIAGNTTITYTLPTGCFTTTVVTVNSLPAITPWSGAVCLGLTTTVAATPAGGTWSSSNIGVATVGASTGIATGIAAGTATLTYSLGTGCNSVTGITVNPLPVIATWSRAICVSGTTTLNATPTGGTWSSSTTSMATIGSLTGVINGVSAGTLTITYTLPTGCIATNTVTVNGLPTGITGVTPLCVGAGATLGSTPTGGVWSSSNTAVATIGSTTGVVAAIAAGTSTVTYTLPTGCYTTAVQTVNPLPAAITGITNVCTGATTALFNASTGGTWTTSNPLLATVGSASGVVTGVAAGTLTITYTLPTGCLITTPFTVNPTPTAFTGTRTVCVGLTTTLSSTPTGGTWSSSNVTEATVVAASGVVTGISAGIPVITYTMPTGCFNTATVTVNPLPAAIAGASSVCTGATTTLSSATTGGTWSSSSTTTATIGSVSGIVTGVAAGNVTMTYTLSTGCIATKAMTVNANPTAITGTLTVCTGLTATVNSTPAGGTWSSSNPAEATIGSTTGIVTGITAGMPTLTYTLSTGCYSTAVFTVNQTPPASTGSNQVCIGLTTTLANTLAGGTWSSSNPTFATVGATTGIVSGLAAGSLNITYTMPTGCFVVTPVTVNANPSALSGPGTLCPGTSITLTSSPTGGVWSSSNTAIATVGSTTGVVTGVLGGTVTISYTLATGCMATRLITVNPAPNLSSFSLPSATSPCIGGSSVVTLNSTSIGAGTYTVTYNLSGANTSTGNIATLVIGATTGTFTIPSSLLTATGAQNITITSITNSFGCSTTLSTGNTASFNVNVLPTVFTVGGGGGYCAGGTGVGITLSGSTVGVNYQLFNGATAIGAAVAGTSTALTFGTFTTAGTYTVVATNATTGCVNNMAGSAVVTVNPLPTTFTITGGGSYCAGGTGVLVGLGGSQSGVNYQLFNGSATVGSPVAGSGSAISFGLQTTAGTYTIVATNATTGCTSTMSGSATVVINPVPTPFTGATTLCVGGTTTLASTPTGGTWTSTNPAVANIGSASGFVTGVSGGSVTITYTLSTGCFNTMGMTINPLPSPITGTVNVCVGSSTTLSSTTTGGAWTTSNPAIATVSTATGVVSGVSAGTVVITYTIGTGCFVTTNVTVNPVPNSISGTSTICVGLSTTLSTSSTGGTWSSSATGVATVGSLTGIVSGAGAGTATIVYSFPTGCNATFPITVNPTPASITGTLNVCVGATRTLSSSTAGGTWTSSNASLAAVGSTTGIVTGVAAGAVIITYTMPTGCLTTTAFTVNPAPAAISGPTNVCLGSTIALTNTTSGGTWSSSSTSIATVTSTGIVSGAGAGTATITYTLPAGCFATQAVTVNPNPATITGTFTACVGTSTTLSNTTAGGTWTSSNPTVASVGGATGIVTGLASGTVTITYTLSTGCFATSVVTINANPAAITGPTNVCTGLTITLADATTGGTWSSSNPAQGSVNATSGVVTGISVGTPIISYTLSTGCFATYPVAVNQSPDPIGGASFVCVGSTTTLTNTYGGGTWSSSNVTLATVGVTTGVVNGLAVGTPVITYTLPPGCIATKVISVNPIPSAIGGTLAVCVGSSTPLTNTVGGGTWTSGNPSVASIGGSTGMVTGVTAGTAAITYTLPGGCFTVATVTVNPLPAAISGVNNVCVGSSITLTNTSAGGTWTSSIPTMATIGATTGIVNGLSAGTINITYTLPTGCYITMPFTVNPLPATITGTAVVCVNATTTLFDATSGGVWSSGNTAVATIGSGTGLVTGIAAGNATISYMLPTGCFVTRIVTVNALPLSFAVTGGGGFCTGGAGVAVGLSGSNTGFSYQLYNGTAAVGSPVAGTGASISFGLINIAGTYTVVATNTVTGCYVTMTGSVTVFGIALPTAYTVTGGGTYCAGGSGFAVGLSGSQTGVNYQLYNGATMMGAPVAGTGSAISFGTQTLAGTYTVVATSSVGCVSGMTGSVNIVVNPLPTVYTVTGGGAYCTGGTGVRIGLSGSASGVNYQLFRGTTLVSTLSGTGATLDFGLITTAGTYTVIAINASTGCTSSMSGSAVIVINPLPTATYTVGGGGSFCSGGTGVAVTLSGSDAGVNYQILVGGTPVGSPLSGTSTSLNFGLQTAPGNYTIVGTSSSTGCAATMTGSVNVVVNPLPTSFTVTGGGSYCAGSSAPTVGLSGSQSGVTYQLFRDGVALTPTVAGTGSSISFGAQATAGVYTVVATSTAGCVRTMTGSTVVAINPLPSAFSVTGGGGYCTGGSGVAVGLSGSQSGVNYQLSNGSGPVGSPVAGTGSAISFGLQTVGSTYTVTAANPATGCTAAMTGSAVVTVNSLPTAFTVTGGGAYCSGGAGANVGLSNSQSGVSYQLFLGTTPMGGAVTGTGSAISFGPQSTTGTYTVVATNITTGCVNNMTGSVTVSVTGLPSVYLVTGGGSYCTGGVGVAIGLSGSQVGVNYQLYNGTSTVGAALAGTGGVLSFGLATAAGTYTVVASAASSCTNNMLGSVAVIVNPLPTAYTVTGGGTFCLGGSGVNVGLSSSSTGVSYQLYRGTALVGMPVSGTGMALNFGLMTIAGSYTVVATNVTTGCISNMTGSATVAVSSLPTAYTVTGGGSYCSGASGLSIGLSSSQTGKKYQLYMGTTAVGSLVTGTGSAISFGLQTTAGTYTVVATDTVTFCTSNMTGSASITVNPLPTLYSVSGGGTFCVGASGVTIGLTGSQSGISYRLYNGTTAIGSPLSGTGLALSFGTFTTAGTYTIVATNTATSCSRNMSGSATIVVNPLPAAVTITGGGSYCAGGSGVSIGLAGSAVGVNYQLYRGTVAVGSPVAGIGSALSFGTFTTTGTYTAVATDASTGCTRNMTGSVSVSVSSLPTAFSLTGGGSFCAGGAGVSVGLSGSSTGVSYQLYLGTTAVGSAISGTGSAISFGLQTTAGTYSVVATNTASFCSRNMTGTATVVVNPVPAVFTVTGGGSYCVGGSGLSIGLSGSSTGVTYQLRNGTAPVGAPVAGTGSAITFGVFTAPGTYTVLATGVGSCTSTMTGSATITVNFLPTAYTVTGGGSFCSGGSGVAVGLSNSTAGISYQLYRGTTVVGSPVVGTGSSISFGLQTIAGTYTVVATNSTTGCSGNMTGSVTVSVASTPTVYTVSGGGAYCSGPGYNIYLSGSQTGVSYRLYFGSTAVGSAISGTGTILNFGLHTSIGTYTVIATNTTSGCTSTMSGSATITAGSAPTAYLVTGGGSFCAGGAGYAVGLSGSQTGVNYQLYRGTTIVGTPVAGTGSSLSFGTMTIAGGYTVVATNPTTGCVRSMTGSATITVNSLPTAFTVTGGGSYCSGGTGVTIGLSGSTSGVSYKLYRSTILVATVSGTGASISFGLQTTAGTYSVVALNTSTGCTSNMTGGATVTVNTTPVVTGSIYTVAPAASITLVGTPSGGSWTSSATSVATVGSSTGVVTGVTLGTTTITYTMSTGCRGTHTVSVTPTGHRGADQGGSAITVSGNGSDIRIVPNPNHGAFSIKGTLGKPEDTEVTLEITNMLGQVVYNGTIVAKNGELDQLIELKGSIANGMYLLSVKYDSENKVFHVIVEK